MNQQDQHTLDVLDGSATVVESEGSLGCSWTETPVSLKLVGFGLFLKVQSIHAASAQRKVYPRHARFFLLTNDYAHLSEPAC